MDTGQIISTVIAVVFGGGGLAAFYKARSTKQVGLSGVEVEDKAATTADWDALSKYWKGEMESLRAEVADLKSQMRDLREERRKDAEEHALERKRWAAERDHLIEELEIRDRWIYEGRPPPPPERRPFPHI